MRALVANKVAIVVSWGGSARLHTWFRMHGRYLRPACVRAFVSAEMEATIKTSSLDLPAPPTPVRMCIGHNSIGHNYIGHNYIGHNYIGHNYRGHN